MDNGHNISEDDVMSKLKDDGDFDRLRIKIIRQLKENEELRNSIIAMVRQSAALTHPGAENMKPRQLSDAIHQEVGDKVVNKISDSLWEIIKSPNGMKEEITETVQSVYNKLLNPQGNENEASSSLNGSVPGQKQVEIIISQANSPIEVDDASDSEPPGFSLSNHNQHHQLKQPKEEPDLSITHDATPIEENSKEPQHVEDWVKHNIKDRAPPDFSAIGESKQPCDGGDDDPDVPPGFG